MDCTHARELSLSVGESLDKKTVREADEDREGPG